MPSLIDVIALRNKLNPKAIALCKAIEAHYSDGTIPMRAYGNEEGNSSKPLRKNAYQLAQSLTHLSYWRTESYQYDKAIDFFYYLDDKRSQVSDTKIESKEDQNKNPFENYIPTEFVARLNELLDHVLEYDRMITALDINPTDYQIASRAMLAPHVNALIQNGFDPIMVKQACEQAIQSLGENKETKETPKDPVYLINLDEQLKNGSIHVKRNFSYKLTKLGVEEVKTSDTEKSNSLARVLINLKDKTIINNFLDVFNEHHYQHQFLEDQSKIASKEMWKGHSIFSGSAQTHREKFAESLKGITYRGGLDS